MKGYEPGQNDRFLMPDTEKPPQRVDITSGGRPLNTMADVDAALEALYQELKAREAAEEAAAMKALPAHETNGNSAK